MTVRITLLTRSDCGLCDHAKAVLERLGGEFDLIVREIDLASPQGQALAAAARMAFPPGVIVDGQAFAFGRLSERRLRRHLARRAASDP